MRAPLDELNIVVAAAGVDSHLMSLRPELRMVKAALLYADTVTLTTPKLALRARFALMERPDEEYRRQIEQTGMTRRPGWQQAITIVRGAQLREQPLTPEEAKTVAPFAEDFAEMDRLRREAAARQLASPEQAELERAVEAGAVVLNSLDFPADDPARHADAVAEEFEDLLAETLDGTGGVYPLFDETAWLSVAPAVRRDELTARQLAPANEAALAARLIIDQVEAFADAEIDVLLDVRERLSGPLTRFRAAMATASQEIETTGFDEAFETEIRNVYRREVTPALTELQESLDDLGARPTLRRAAEPAAQWLGIGAAGATAITELGSAAVSAAAGLLSATGAAARAELQHRRHAREQQKKNSYFFLWQADRLIPPSQ